jgi:hypothetical protein
MFRYHQTLHDAQLSLDEDLKKQIEGPEGQRRPAEGVEWKPPRPAESVKEFSKQVAMTRLYGLQGRRWRASSASSSTSRPISAT